MFYVVRLAGINGSEKHQVFPIAWMKDSDTQLEKFVKKSINRNLLHILFWSNEKNDAGEPVTSVQPNFDLPIQNSFPSASYGCFLGQPLNFFCDFADAVAYMNRMRPAVPGLYNARRLAEAPVPDLNQNVVDQNPAPETGNSNDDGRQIGGNDNGSENENSNGSLQSNGGNHTEVSGSENLSDNGGNDNALDHGNAGSSAAVLPDSTTGEEIETKPQFHSLQRADVAEIDAILNGVAIDNDEENTSGGEVDGVLPDGVLEMVVINGKFPKPVKYSSDNMIKRENDPVSGNWAYNDAPQVMYIVACSFWVLPFCHSPFTHCVKRINVYRKMEIAFTKSAQRWWKSRKTFSIRYSNGAHRRMI